jgi:plastocyanin
MRSRNTPAAVLAALAVLALMAVAAACGSAGATTTTSPTPTPPSDANGAVVTISDFAFLPQKIEIRPGTTVTWSNNDAVTHTVTSTDGFGVDAKTTFTFGSDALGQGQTFSFTFDKAGTYFYECTIHKSLPAMHGEIIVSAAASARTASTPAASPQPTAAAGSTTPAPAPTASTNSGGGISGY